MNTYTVRKLQKITIRTNHWCVPSSENALDGWLEGIPSEKEIRQARVTALKERATWKPSEEGLKLVDQLKEFIGTRVQIQFWTSIMFMCYEMGPFPLEGDCKDVLLLQQGEFLQAFMVLDNVRAIPTPEGFTPMGYLTTVDGLHGQLASLANVCEVWPVNPDGSASAEKQDCAEVEAILAVAVGKASIPMGHRLAGVLTDAMSETRFVEQWLDETDKSFRPFATAILDLCNVKRMTEKSQRAVYQDLCVRKRQAILTDVLGEQVPPKVIKLMSRTSWKKFSRRDWATFITLAMAPKCLKLGHLTRITPNLVRQFHLIPEDFRAPALYRVVSHIKIPAERWHQLRGFLNGASATQRAEYRRAAGVMTSNGDFWDLYHRCEGKHYRPFNIPASAFDSKLLDPIASPREMEVEAHRMKSCLANQVRRVHDGDRIYFKLRGDIAINAELVRQEMAWVPGEILGYENAPVTPEIANHVAAELQRLALTMPLESESPNKKLIDDNIDQLRLDARNSFAADEIAHLSSFLKSIQGKSRSWTDGAYAIFELSRERYVQFLSSPDGREYLMEISSHRYVESVNNSLSADAVALLEKVGFIWPTERTNYFRWFKVSSYEDIQAMAELALAMLAGIFGYHTGKQIKVTNHFPRDPK